jgi:hypothetical protein
MALIGGAIVAYFNPSPNAPIICYGFVIGSGSTLLIQWFLGKK